MASPVEHQYKQSPIGDPLTKHAPRFRLSIHKSYTHPYRIVLSCIINTWDCSVQRGNPSRSSVRPSPLTEVSTTLPQKASISDFLHTRKLSLTYLVGPPQEAKILSRSFEVQDDVTEPSANIFAISRYLLDSHSSCPQFLAALRRPCP